VDVSSSSRRDVDGIAEDVELANHRPLDVATHQLAGINAHADPERDRQSSLAIVVLNPLPHLERCGRRGVCGVLQGNGVAEHGHEFVAQILIDGAAVFSRDFVE
jgi:hypothetical protein